MERFVVIEEGEGIEKAIQWGRMNCRRRGEVFQNGPDPALLVVSPRAARGNLKLPRACRTALLPGNAGGLLGGVCAVSAVSYGTSPKDSLTISSREADLLWMAIQRELVTVDGEIVERQEFSLRISPWTGELSALAVAGALLLLGISPEEFRQFPPLKLREN